ncbi:MAG: Ig-like domain repeat protein [Planctomycetota bacterium]|jgi:tetratricopeptide (TPR) repeat protein
MRTLRSVSFGAAVLASAAALVLPVGPAGAAEPAAPKVYEMSGSRGWIVYSLEREIAGGATVIEVWYRRDGGKWVKYGEDRDLKAGRMIFKAPGAGTYDITTVAVDAAGNREKKLGPDTPAEFRVIVDHGRPELSARIEFPPAERAAAVKDVRFSWLAKDTNLPDFPVTVQARLEGQPRWRPVFRAAATAGREELLRLAAAGSGSFGQLSAFANRLHSGILEVRFRATDRAGNRTYSPTLRVRIDRAAPFAEALGPILSATRDVLVTYRVEDEGQAGIAEVTAWVSADGGRSWRKAGAAPPGRGSVPVSVEPRGVYGLYVTARDRAGNEGAPPRPGTKPQVTMLVDSAPPRASLAGCLIVRSDRRRFADGKLGKARRAELLKALKSYPDGEDFGKWAGSNADLWRAILKEQDTDADGKLGAAELEVLTGVLKHPMTFAELPRLGGAALSSRQVLLLKWKVVDENLPAAPVTIEFSADGGDEWHPLASGLKNAKAATGDESARHDTTFTGSHFWSPPEVNSTRCLLRLKVADRAGNETVVISRPFSVDNRAPRSSVKGFEPIEEEKDEGGEPAPPAPAPERGAAAPSVDDLLASAHACLTAGARRGAIEKAAAALKRDPERVAGHLMLGRAMAGSDDAEALKHFLRAEELAPEAEGLAEDLAHVCFRLGRARAHQGRIARARPLLARAVDCFARVLAVRGSAASHYNLGLALVYASRTSTDPGPLRARARRELSEAVRTGRENRAIYAHSHWWLAVLQEEDRRYRDAVRLYRAAAELYGPKSEMGKRSLARARSARRRR